MRELVLLTLAVAASVSQAQWSWRNPMPVGTSLAGVCFTDAKTGTAVGAGDSWMGVGPVILRTSDGGNTWTAQWTGTSELLSAVSFATANTGTVVGQSFDSVSSSGLVLRTTNRGVTWTRQVSGTSNHLRAVSFVDANTGTAVGDGGTIIRTTDGGAHWTTQSSGTTSRLHGVCFVDANNGTAVGGEYHSVGWYGGYEGIILRTTNGGITWVRQASGLAAILSGVTFTDTNNGYAVGGTNDSTGYRGIILHTTDGGVTWTAQSSHSNRWLYAVSFSSREIGTAVGQSYWDGRLYEPVVILRTTNGGVTWTKQTSPASEDLNSVYFADGANGVAVGDHGTIICTSDGGASWTRRSHGAIVHLNAVSFSDADNGTAVGGGWVYGTTNSTKGVILATSDGGASWRSQLTDADDLLNGVILNGITCPDRNTRIAVGEAIDSLGIGRGVILRSTNAGRSWASQLAGTTCALRGVSFSDLTTGSAVGDSGTVLRTTDGGTTWTRQTSGTTTDLRAVSFVDTRNGTVVGGGYRDSSSTYLPTATILRTTNGGTTWQKQSSDNPYPLYGVSFIDENIGTAVGGTISNPIILHTTNGGVTWTRQDVDSFGISSYLKAVSFADPNNGIAVGGWTYEGPTYFNVLLRTTNGGASWKRELLPASLPLTGVAFTDQRSAVVVGWFGTILGASYGGVTAANAGYAAPHGIPQQVALLQNFPNPFNPSTTITYQLSKPTSVTLNIFNALGQLVATLLDEKKDAGFYSVSWNANVPSGIYFYRLQAGGFMDTKKMILLR